MNLYNLSKYIILLNYLNNLIHINSLTNSNFNTNQSSSPDIVRPLSIGNRDLRREIAYRYSASQNFFARELSRLLNSSHIRHLIDAHDTISERILQNESNYQNQLIKTVPKTKKNDTLKPKLVLPNETLKIVGLRHSPNKSLGITVGVNDRNQLYVSRILSGGIIDMQGLLHEGDIIKEINGTKVNHPTDLKREVAKDLESITFKIEPNDLDEYKLSDSGMTSGFQVIFNFGYIL